ncbi:unnamed protein product, partial [Hymenolepis diminuta]
MTGIPNETRINMLLRKFSTSDHDLYLTYLLPLSLIDLTCFKCRNLAKHEGEDIHKYAAVGLRSPCYAENRPKLLPLIDENPDILLNHQMDEHNNIRSLIADSNMIKSNETRARRIKKPEIDQ